MSAINYNRYPGMGDLPGDSSNPNSPDYDDSADVARDEAIDALLADPKWVAENKALADEWNDGSFSGEHYSDVERALADIADVHGADLIGSDALVTVLRLAKIHGDARKDRLRELAEQEIDRQEAA